MDALAALGFSDFFRAQLTEQELAAGLVVGRVVAQHRGEWDIITADGPRRAILAGRHYDERGTTLVLGRIQPTVGDWVLLAEPDDGKLWVIERLLDRRSHLERGVAGRRRESQTIVANVDLVVIVCAVPRPDTQDAAAGRSVNPRRIERYLAAVAQGGAEGLILINKADLSPDAGRLATELGERFAPCGVLAVSALDEGGLDTLRERLVPGLTVSLVGLSGVGKSSIVNALLGRSAQRTSAEREHDARGRHTTTHRELFVTETGALLVDTPGMREFALSGDADDDVGGFDDVLEVAGLCRFRDCRHKDEPGCAVRAAVERGELLPERLSSYHKLSGELDQQKAMKRRIETRSTSKRDGRGPLRGTGARKRAR